MKIYDIFLFIFVVFSAIAHVSHFFRLGYFKNVIDAFKETRQDKRDLRSLANESVNRINANFLEEMKSRYENVPVDIQEEAKDKALNYMKQLVKESYVHNLDEISIERIKILIKEEFRKEQGV